MIALSDIQAAAERIRPFIHRTPLIPSNSLSALSGVDVHLKLENLQKTGSFKVRGAFNKLLEVAGERVIAASMGNHAQAVAFAAGKLGKRATIVMPSTAAIVKEEATRGYGAEVVLTGDRFSDALAYALQRTDHVFIHPFDDDAVMAGQGSIGLEVCEDIAAPDVILVPVGGGGLIAGIATAVKALSPRTTVIGVQAAAAPAVCRSLAAGGICEQAPSTTIADGIAVNRPGTRTFEVISRTVDEMIEVGDESIARSILLLLERKKIVAEGAGAAPLAALLDHAGRFKGKKAVVVLSGGNIDFTVVDRIIRKGLVTSGRVGTVAVLVPDVPGSLLAVTRVLASLRANVLEVQHERLAGDLPLGKTRIVLTVETRGRHHLREVVSALTREGYEAGERI